MRRRARVASPLRQRCCTWQDNKTTTQRKMDQAFANQGSRAVSGRYSLQPCWRSVPLFERNCVDQMRVYSRSTYATRVIHKHTNWG